MSILKTLKHPSSIRIHLISLSYHFFVILSSHFSSMEQMLMSILMLAFTGSLNLLVHFRYYYFIACK